VPVGEGAAFIVELSDGQGAGVIRATRGEELVESSAESFESVRTHTQLASLQGHTGLVSSLTFSPGRERPGCGQLR
jgi:hypothetical protein